MSDNDRAIYVGEACGDDSGLRSEVEALLAADNQLALIDEPAVAAVAQGLAKDRAAIVGRRLGPYEVVGLLGAGGMGEVYRARDTTLDRDVALKILPEVSAADPDRIARFRREAQVLASLNHPSIAAIYGFEDSDGMNALVLELVEGPTLADRIAGGAVPVGEALPIARQIADALEAAHERGIVHRDLKPANIKLRHDGTVKVLDFGLAKVANREGQASPLAPISPVSSAHATAAGIIVGTASYLSPEQAAGKAADKRSDLWAFGVVLLEMLAGEAVFAGDTVADVLRAVVTSEPDWSALPSDTPPSIRRLLGRCLEKDRRRRLADASDARLEIDEALERPTRAPSASISRARAISQRWRLSAAWVLAAATFIIGAVLAWRGVDRAEHTPLYTSLDLPPGFVLGEDGALISLPSRTPIVFSPDGGALVVQASRAGTPQLFLRTLDRPDLRPINGTAAAHVPFVSPDGKWVGFWTPYELRKVPISGGPITTICPLRSYEGPNGVAWGPNDVIVFADDDSGRLMRVPAGGGKPEPLTAKPPTARHPVTPFFLPDGKRLLYADVATNNAADARLMVLSLDGGDPKLVVEGATDGRVLPSGQLAFMRQGTLMVAPFNVSTAQLTGAPISVLENVMQSGVRRVAGVSNTGAGMFAVSSRGALAAIRGGLIGSGDNVLLWTTKDGRHSAAEPKSGAPTGERMAARISPDRSRALVEVQTPTRGEFWIADWKRDAWSLCASCAGDSSTVWSHDSRHILAARRDDTLVTYAIDGSTPEDVLVREDGRSLRPTDWLPDGRVVYMSSPNSRDWEIKLLEPGAGAGRRIVPAAPPSMLTDAEVSPDGKWLAYDVLSSEPFRGDVFVQAFPGPGERVQVSTGLAYNPSWSADGRTLYYLVNKERDVRAGSGMFAVDIATSGDRLIVGAPRQMFDVPEPQGCRPKRCYDVTGGPRFLFHDSAASKRVTASRIDLILGWISTLPKPR